MGQVGTCEYELVLTEDDLEIALLVRALYNNLSIVVSAQFGLGAVCEELDMLDEKCVQLRSDIPLHAVLTLSTPITDTLSSYRCKSQVKVLACYI